MGGRGVPYRFGSKTDVNGETQAETVEKLKDILYRMLPQTRSLKLDQTWCGVLGVPRDWCTTAGLTPKTGIAWAGGYVGLGVSTSNFSGQTVAPDGAMDIGVWECSPGSVTADRSAAADFCYFLQGKIVMTHLDGTRCELGPSDAIMLPRGWKSTWDSLEHTRKIYVFLADHT